MQNPSTVRYLLGAPCRHMQHSLQTNTHTHSNRESMHASVDGNTMVAIVSMHLLARACDDSIVGAKAACWQMAALRIPADGLADIQLQRRCATACGAALVEYGCWWSNVLSVLVHMTKPIKYYTQTDEKRCITEHIRIVYSSSRTSLPILQEMDFCVTRGLFEKC